MDMIRLDIQLDNLALLPGGKGADAGLDLLRDRAGQYAIAVFRGPRQMAFGVIDNMC